MKTFVVGALGTVGVWVVERLLDEGQDVVAADVRDDFSLRPSLKGVVPFRRVDLLDTEALAQALTEERPDCVCHLAARTTGTPTIDGDPDPYSSFLINGMGPISVLDAARRAQVDRVAFASTKGVYGPFSGEHGYPTYRPVNEEHPRRSHPTSRPYSAAKILAEEAGQYYSDRFGISFRALRFGNIIRPGKKGIGGGGAATFPAMVAAALRGEPFSVEAIEGVKDDLVYVKDVAQGIGLACTVDVVSNWAFNIATGRASTMADYVAAVRAAIPGADITLEVTSGVDTYGVRGVLDIGRAQRELGYRPAFDLPSAVVDLAEVMSSQGRADDL